MNKPNYLTIILIASSFVIGLQACTNSEKPVVKSKPVIANHADRTAQLIKEGEALQNAHIDSLLPIQRELYQIGTTTQNNQALLHAEIFDAYYNWLKAQHTPAMKAALKALSDAERWHMNGALPKIYSIISNLHKESHNYDQAFAAIDKGIAAARLNRDTADLIMTLGNKAMFTHGYYFFNNRPHDDKTSLGLQLSALKLSESHPKYESKRVQFYNNIAQTYKERKEYEKTLYYGNKAVVLAKKYNRQRSLTYSYCWLGEAYYYMGQHQKGLDYLNQAIIISREIKEPYRAMEINEAIYDCYTSTGNYQEALKAHLQYVRLKDSLEVLKSSRQLNELQIKYDAVKKDKEIAGLNELNKLNKRNVVLITISAVLFLLLFVMILIRYFGIRKNNKMITGKNTGLNDALLKIAFIQSHEIRKPLATLLGIVNVIKEDNYIADKELLKMIETSANNLDNKIREIIKEVEGK